MIRRDPLRRAVVVGVAVIAFATQSVDRVHSAPSDRILFITGAPVGSLGPGDAAIKAHLEAPANGSYTVDVESTTGTVLAGDASGHVLVLISSTAGVTQLGTTFRDLNIPVVAWQAASGASASIFDLSHLALSTAGGYGTANLFSEVVMAPADPILAPDDSTIVGQPGYLAGGFDRSGSGAIVAVTATPQTLSYGRPPTGVTADTGAFVMATLGVDTNEPAVFAYEVSRPLAGGSVAHARRVGLFLTNNTAASLTADGWKLFDAAVAWAQITNLGPTVTVAMPQPYHLNAYQETTDLGLPPSGTFPFQLNRLMTAADVDAYPYHSQRTYTWSGSGPGITAANMHDPGAIVSFPYPNPATSSADYQYTLTLSDGDKSGSSSATVRVNLNDDTGTLVNQPPIVDPGSDPSPLVLSTTTPIQAQLVLTTKCIDDGLPVPPHQTMLTWISLNGPAPVTFSPASQTCAPTATTATATATFTKKGLYTLQVSGSDGGATTTVVIHVTVNGNALLVVKDIPSPTTPLLSSEVALMNRLTSLGYNVAAMGGAASTSWATGRTVVVIAGTVTDSNVTNKFRSSAVPVVVLRNSLFDDMNMTTTATANFGTAPGSTQIAITNPTHPLAAGLTGSPGVASNSTFAWGKPPASAVTIATLTTDSTKAAIFAYDQGAVMATTTAPATAPARRVGFFADLTTPAVFTNEGGWLFDAAVGWSTQANLRPRVYAGPNLSIPYTTGVTAVPQATAWDDGPVGALTYRWTQLSGSTASLSSTSALQPTITFPAPDTYQFELTATDALGTVSDASDFTAYVYTSNTPPTISIVPVPTQTLVAPSDPTWTQAPAQPTLTATVTDDGFPIGGGLTMAWDQVWGPATVTFGSPTAAVTTASFPAQGSYRVRLTARDAPVSNPAGLSSSQTVDVTVLSTALLVATPNSLQDGVLTDRLAALQYTVTKVDPATIPNAATAATIAAGNAVMIISPTVNPTDVAAKFKTVKVPAVVSRYDLFDDFGMTTAANLGTVTLQTQVAMVAPTTDPMSLGLSGTFTVGFRSTFGWGVPSATAVKVTTLASDSTKSSIFRYERGVTLPGGGTAAARRVGFFATTSTLLDPATLNKSDSGGLPLPPAESLNETGLELFDAAVTWAANAKPPSRISAGSPLSLFRTGSSVTGTLQGSVFPATTPVTWSVTSGSGITFANPSSATTSATFTTDSALGQPFVVRLSANDGSGLISETAVYVVSSASTNQAPVVSAGPDLLRPAGPVDHDNSISLPNAAVLLGTAYDDGLPTPAHLTILWAKVTGPGVVTFANSSLAATTATFSEPGRYLLSLTANDGSASSTAYAKIDVNAKVLFITAAAQPNTLESKVLTHLNALNLSVTTLDATSSTSASADNMSLVLISPSVTDANVSTKFTAVATPALVAKSTLFDDFGFVSPATNVGTTTAQTNVVIPTTTHPLAYGLSGAAQVPIVSSSTVGWATLTAAQTTPIKIASLPSASTHYALFAYEKGIALPTGAIAQARRVGFGFCLPDTLTDKGWALFDNAVRWAMSANSPPLVSAGSAQTLTVASFPATGTLAGSVNDDGQPSPVTSTWTELEGPSGATFTAPSQPVTGVQFPGPGTYVFQLSATDGLLTAVDSATVDVALATAANVPPAVNAGPDATAQVNIPLPIRGVVSDDGIPGPLTVAWTASGPGTVTFGSSTALETTATFPATGVYVLTLKATDGPTGDPRTLVTSASRQVFVVPGKTALLVVAASRTAGDLAIRDRLTALGFTTTLKTDVNLVGGDYFTKDLVVVGSSATNSLVGTRLQSAKAPVIVAQSAYYHDMGFADVTAGTDYGSTTGLTQVDLNDSPYPLTPYPLAGGLSGTVTLTTAPDTFNWASGLTGSQWNVATIPGQGAHSALFAFEQGEIMLAATTAPARRVGFFSGSGNLFTDDAWRIFDAAVAWATTPTVPALFVKGQQPFTGSEVGTRRRMATLGYSLTDVTDAAVQASDAANVALVLVSESVDPTILGTKLRDVNVPVITFDPGEFAAMGMTGSTAGIDFGNTPTQREVEIIDPSNALAAGLTDRQQVLLDASNDNFGWALPAATASRVAVVTGFSYGATVFAYEQGVPMVGGVTANARRVGFFMTAKTLNNNQAVNMLNPGWQLFDAAVNWCGAADPDHDGLSTYDEYLNGTNPFVADTNGDGIPDGAEVRSGRSATNTDMDGDGLTNAQELRIGTDPFNPDTDGDTAKDGVDCFPLDKTRSFACPGGTQGDTTPPTITLTTPANNTLVSHVP